jgi:hypothetical protein
VNGRPWIAFLCGGRAGYALCAGLWLLAVGLVLAYVCGLWALEATGEKRE